MQISGPLSVFLFLFVWLLSLVMSSYFSGASLVHLSAAAAVAADFPSEDTECLSLVVSRHLKTC